MKKRTLFTSLVTLILLLTLVIASSKTYSQTLNFTISKDTVNTNEQIELNNISTGFNQSHQFKWDFSACAFWALNQNPSCSYYTAYGDSLAGEFNNFANDTIIISLSAYDSLGNLLSIPYKSITLYIYPQPLSYVWTIDSCHEAFDTCGNLVCNGDFSWMSDTLTGMQQVYLVQPWNDIGSADLFSNNTTNTNVSTPSNGIAYQLDHSTTGIYNNYTGFAAGVLSTSGVLTSKEYIHSELKSNLLQNQRYKVELYANLANYSSIACDGFQVLFTDSFYYGYNPPANTQNWDNVVDFGLPIVSDTLNWTLLSDVFIPQHPNLGNIIIGNVKPNSIINIDTVCLSCYPFPYQMAYYLVDDISVIPLAPKLNLTNQTICNPGDTVVIYANAVGDSTLLWSTSSTADSIIVAPTTTTFYTITATDYIACNTVVDTAWVYVLPSSPKPQVWLNDAYSCNDTDSAIFTVQGIGATSYLWSTGDTTASIIVPPTINATYTVTVSGQYSPCTDTILQAQVITNLYSPAPIISGNLNTCDTILPFSISNYYGFYQYYWTLDHINYQTINANQFLIDGSVFPAILSGGNIWVIVKDTICNTSDSTLYSILPCCITASYSLLLNHSSVLDNNHPNYNSTSQRIEFNSITINVNDTLYIDNNTIFDACEIYMGPYASIILRNGDSLFINNSYLFPCDTILWGSIVIPNSTQYLSLATTTISSAIEAIRIENGAASYFHSNTFNRNYRSVVIKNYNPQIPNPVPISGYTPPASYNGLFKENTIDGSNAVLLYPKKPKKAYSGIELFNVYGFTIGDPNNQSQANSFKNLDYGIFGENSEYEVYYSVFDSINPYAMGVGISAGGIYCHSGAIVNFTPLSNTIPYNPPPVYVSAIMPSVTAYYNTINNSSMGIYSGNGGIDARHNTIHAKHNGIVAHEPKTNSNIRYNTIDIDTYVYSNSQIEYTGIGILANSVFKKIININISDNTINDPPKTGIWLENLSSTSWYISGGARTVAGNNTVNITSSINSNNDWKHYAIRISNCDRAIVGFNQIINHNSLQPSYWEKQKGISIRDCKDARVYSNYPITNMGIGIHVVGNNINTQFYCNSITNSYNGFYFEYGSGVATYISDQGSTDWATDNAWNNMDTVQGGMRMAGMINLSLVGPPNQWHFRGNGGYDLQIFNPRIIANNLFVNKLWGQPGNTSATICPQPSPNPNDPTEAISYEELRDHYFGEIVRDEIDFEVLAEEFGYFNGEYFYEEMEEYSDWLSLGTMDDTIYQNYYNYLLNSNLSEFDSVITLMEDGSIDDAINRNNGIIPGNAIETNQKFVDYVYLYYYIKDSLPNASELQTLEYIALLTPWVGGEAVYSARILLGIDPDRHGIAYRLQKDKTTSSKNSNLSIYPNPTNSDITIEFLNTQEGEISIKIIDILGKTVFENNYEASKSVQIDITNLKSGVYHLLIYTNHKLYETKSVIKY